MSTNRLDGLVPIPVRLLSREGSFRIDSDTIIAADELAMARGRQLSEMLAPAIGRRLSVAAPTPQDGCIALSIDASLANLGDEGYRISVTPRRAEVIARTSRGVFWGMQTLRQLLPDEIFSNSKADGVSWDIPAVDIEDRPRFAWRGMHLDCCRHFMPIEFLYKWVDLLSMHKIGVFHWHLTEDQGWRIEIKKYPKLTEVGAWRKETIVGHMRDKPYRFDGTRHGGSYSQDEIRKLVRYADERNVTIVPEIEMPGHSQAAIAAYPELGCTGKQIEVATSWGIMKDILNAEDSTIRFYQDVLSEVMELFPSTFIHVGGDEAVKDQWKASPRIQQRIKELGLKDEHELQSWFIRQMDQFLTSRGRRLVGWDEILEGGLAPGATVMSWRGEEGGIAAAKAGHDVVMAPHQYVYFDHLQSQDKAKEPPAFGGFTPIEKVYGYEPIPAALNEEQARRVLGAQGQIWTEYIPTSRQVEYMAFPRACALAEVVWSAKHPAGQRDFGTFRPRLRAHLERLKRMDVNFRELDG
jgi:hexosaminidase